MLFYEHLNRPPKTSRASKPSATTRPTATCGCANRIAAAPTPLTSWQAVGGGIRLRTTAARMPNGKLEVLTLRPADGDTCLRAARTCPSAGWRCLGGSGLVGTPTAVQTRLGLRIFARKVAGAVQTAVYEGRTFTAWSTVGGVGLNGTVAAVPMPGY